MRARSDGWRQVRSKWNPGGRAGPREVVVRRCGPGQLRTNLHYVSLVENPAVTNPAHLQADSTFGPPWQFKVRHQTPHGAPVATLDPPWRGGFYKCPPMSALYKRIVSRQRGNRHGGGRRGYCPAPWCPKLPDIRHFPADIRQTSVSSAPTGGHLSCFNQRSPRGTAFARLPQMNPSSRFHFVARALPGTLLFHDWTEALALWERLVVAFPDADALCLMPNHPHIVSADAHGRAKLSRVMSAFARWRAARRKDSTGSCWMPQPDPVEIPDEKHLRRTIRYVLLNPCRGGLAADPLAWPLSNHRDLVGLGTRFAAVPQPVRFHTFVSSDTTVALVGSTLPGGYRGRATTDEIVRAVSSILRIQPAEMFSNRFATETFVTLAARCEMSVNEIAATTGRLPSAIYARLTRSAKAATPVEKVVLTCERVIGDSRFNALDRFYLGPAYRWDQWKQPDVTRPS